MFRTNELQTFYKHGFVGTSQKSAYNINAGKIKNPENPMISGLRAFDFFNTAEREAVRTYEQRTTIRYQVSEISAFYPDCW